MNKFFTLALLFLTTVVMGQIANQHKIDSINYLLRRPRPDLVKVKLLIELSNQLPYLNPK